MKDELKWIVVDQSRIGKVVELAREIWPVVYADMISREQIDYMLDWMYSPEKISEEIASGVEYLLIRSSEESCGFAAFGPVDSDGICFLHKLYMSPQWQRKGLGSRTLREIFRRGSKQGARAMELRVNRTNRAAIELYQSSGFEIVGEDCADIGSGFVMDDYILRNSSLLESSR